MRGRLGLALLAAALVSAAACGSDSTTQTGSGPPTTAPTTSTPSTSTTSPAAPTTTVTTEAPPTTTITADAPTTAVTTVARPTATIDELVGAEGERVHVRCVGEGDTTVVLIAGFGGDTTGWANVEPAIAARARVCSYDRPGTGTSDPATATATFTTEATDLHDLLRTIGEPGPYVVVGQSFGGAEAVMFASLYADEVSGLALVDASPTTWPAALCSVPDDGTEAAATVLGICAALPPNGQQRAPRRRRRLRRSVKRRLARVVADGCDHSRRSRTAQPAWRRPKWHASPRRGTRVSSHGRRFRPPRTW